MWWRAVFIKVRVMGRPHEDPRFFQKIEARREGDNMAFSEPSQLPFPCATPDDSIYSTPGSTRCEPRL
jgi:hypothetical protein